MFLRQKKSGNRTYLQLVENRWEDGRPKQRVLYTLGRLEDLQESGELAGLARSASGLSDALLLLEAHSKGEAPVVRTSRIGPGLVFERLWKETGCQAVIRELLQGRKFTFSVERSIFLEVLHRLFAPGSDRAADKWRLDYRIEGVEGLQLHHQYRAMAWLGEVLPEGEEQEGRTPFSPRCTKDLVEEELFLRRRDLFTSLDLVFFDTTSIYFEGEGGETLGRRGHSKDSRPDLKQMVVGAVLDQAGHPVCCEMWPGNTTDVKTLLPIVDRLRRRFAIERVCIVADRGMISAETIAELEGDKRDCQYILGARMRRCKEVRDEVLSRQGRYHEVYPERLFAKDPSPLKVKEVKVEGRRYVVCVNEEQRRKDAADRQATVTSLREKLRQGDKALVGNKGYRKYIAKQPSSFQIDEDAIKEDARFDGKWVLRTNLSIPTEDVVLHYKQLWTVEDVFRSAKTLLETRPIYHKRDETIRGHVFCSFLALVLRKELQHRLEHASHTFEWADIIQGLERLTETEVCRDNKRFLLRSEVTGAAGKVCQAVGVALPRTVRLVGEGS
jgi:transposase